MYIFLVLVRLRDEPAHAGALRVPGGRPGLYLVAAIGFAATAISLGLCFVPPPGTGHVLNYEIKLIAEAVAVMGIGLGFYRHSIRSTNLAEGA